jgi:hypothetical protein
MPHFSDPSYPRSQREEKSKRGERRRGRGEKKNTHVYTNTTKKH